MRHRERPRRVQSSDVCPVREYRQLGHVFATSAGLHPTDATALIEILRAEESGAPLSPARLSERIGLTSGATSTLLNRLEDAGHIRRSRVHSDRRVVTLHSTSGIHETADAFFDPLEECIVAVMSVHSPQAREEFVTILSQLRQAIHEYSVQNGDAASLNVHTPPDSAR